MSTRTPIRHWTAKEDALLRQHYPNMRAPELVSIIGRCAGAIWARAKWLGIRKTPLKKYRSPEATEKFKATMAANKAARQHAYRKAHDGWPMPNSKMPQQILFEDMPEDVITREWPYQPIFVRHRWNPQLSQVGCAAEMCVG